MKWQFVQAQKHPLADGALSYYKHIVFFLTSNHSRKQPNPMKATLAVIKGELQQPYKTLGSHLWS